MIATISAILAMALVPQGGGGFGGGGQGGQGGQGQQGGGGFGGAGARGAQGNAGREMGQEQTFSHILTQGDKTDWPFKCKAGEVLILRATSETFDPGIEVVDSTGKKIGENDDEEEGLQNALLLVYIEKDGEYKAHVKNYRNAGGGRYDFSVRRFMTQTVTTDGPVTLTPNPDHNYYLRILAPKGKLISLHNNQGNSFTTPIDSDAKPTSWRKIYTNELVNVFDVKKDAYYVQTSMVADKDRKAVVSAVVAQNFDAELNKPKSTDPTDVGIHVWRMKVKAGDFLKFHAKGTTALPCYFPAAIGNEAEGGIGFQIVQDTKKWAETITVMFDKTGDIELLVPPNDAHRGYTFNVTEAWKPWDGVSPIDNDLSIGSTVYYGFDAKPGYMTRLAASAKTFDMIYRLFNSRLGQIQGVDDDAVGNMNASTTISLPHGGRHYLAVSCFGGGGGGQYQVSSVPIKPSVLKIGVSTEATLSSPLEGLWSLSIDKPQTLVLRLKTNGGAPTMLMDPKGNQVPLRSVAVRPGDYMMIFDAQVAGEYRIWRQWTGGKEAYSMKVGPVAD